MFRITCHVLLCLFWPLESLLFFLMKYSWHTKYLFLIPPPRSPPPPTLFHLLKSCLILKAQEKPLFLYEAFFNSPSLRSSPLQTCDFWNTQSGTWMLLELPFVTYSHLANSSWRDFTYVITREPHNHPINQVRQIFDFIFCLRVTSLRGWLFWSPGCSKWWSPTSTSFCQPMYTCVCTAF